MHKWMLYYLKQGYKMEKFLTCITALSLMIMAGNMPVSATDIQTSTGPKLNVLENASITYDMIDSIIKENNGGIERSGSWKIEPTNNIW